jgi:hypothetical protein
VVPVDEFRGALSSFPLTDGFSRKEDGRLARRNDMPLYFEALVLFSLQHLLSLAV